MNKLTKISVLLSLTSFATVAISEDTSKLPVFVHYTHDNDVDAHVNLACEVGKASSFSAPYMEQDNPNLPPKWEVFVKPISLIDGVVEIEATIFEHGERVMAPRVKTNLGEPVSITATDSTSGSKMTLDIKTQRSDGLAPVTTLKYKPRHISINDAITYTSLLTDQMEKIDLRTYVSYGNEIEFVGTEDFLKIIRGRLAEVDVESAATIGNVTN